MELPAELLTVGYGEPVRRWLRKRWGPMAFSRFDQERGRSRRGAMSPQAFAVPPPEAAGAHRRGSEVPREPRNAPQVQPASSCSVPSFITSSRD